MTRMPWRTGARARASMLRCERRRRISSMVWAVAPAPALKNSDTGSRSNRMPSPIRSGWRHDFFSVLDGDDAHLCHPVRPAEEYKGDAGGGDVDEPGEREGRDDAETVTERTADRLPGKGRQRARRPECAEDAPAV